MSSSSPVELLRQQTQSTPSPQAIKSAISLSPDATQLTFHSTNTTVDAKIKYRPTESISTDYSLASLYLACIHSDKYVSYRNACKEYKVDDILRVSDQKEVLNYFGCGAASTAGGGDAPPPAAEMEEGEDDDVAMPPANADDSMNDKADNKLKRERDDTAPTTESEKERQKRKQSSSSSHHRDKHRDHHKDRKHHHKDKHHRDKHHSKDKHDDKKEKKSSSHHHSTTTIMTNEQILDNLITVAGKRGDNRKVKDDDVEMMEEMAHVMTQNAGDETTKDGEGGRPAGAAAPPSTSNDDDNNATADEESEEQRLAREKQLVLDALSAEGYTLEGREMTQEEREKTESITMIEQPVGDTASILRFPGRDFSKVLQLYLEAREQQQQSSTKSKSKHSSSSQSSKSKHSSSSSSKKLTTSSTNHPSSSSSSRKKLGHPVIIVPQGMTSPITLINAHPFFSTSKFIPRDVLRKRGTKPPPSPVLLTRRISHSRLAAATAGQQTVTYEIIDNPVTKLHPREWDRIVAVVCQGAEWQFKGWQWSRPVDIFTNCFGYYVGMEGAPVPKSLREWNVRVARLNRDKRGLDSVACATFWNGLDEFMAVKKPEYLPLS